MKKNILLFSIFFFVFKLSAQQVTVTDSTIISLITCSPGPEVYAKFGHTALRVKDPVAKTDIVFNYGIFSFQTSNFYVKFVNGETDYQLGVYETAYFLPEYEARNSMVREQILNLTLDEKQKLIGLLFKNYEPENRIYRYNFVFDNCATRPRDKILEALNGVVRYRTAVPDKTFRQWIGAYVGTDTWVKLGIDVIFGMDADKIASQNQSMFLPEVLLSEFQDAQIKSSNGTSRKLVTETKTLVNRDERFVEPEESWFSKPMFAFILLLFAGTIITFWEIKKQRNARVFDTVVLIASGLAGLIALYLMLFSTHPLVGKNLNLLWLNPLNIIAGMLVWAKSNRLRNVFHYYQLLNVTLLGFALLAAIFSIQVLNPAAFPAILLLILRTVKIIKYDKR